LLRKRYRCLRLSIQIDRDDLDVAWHMAWPVVWPVALDAARYAARARQADMIRLVLPTI